MYTDTVASLRTPTPSLSGTDPRRRMETFQHSCKASLHVAKNLINGRRAQVSFHRLTDTSSERFAFRDLGSFG
jgi:hypothetical protein